jgi:hypothetical protein
VFVYLNLVIHFIHIQIYIWQKPDSQDRQLQAAFHAKAELEALIFHGLLGKVAENMRKSWKNM